MKRLTTAAVVTLLVIMLLAGGYFYLQDSSFGSSAPLKAIPSDAIAVFEFHQPDDAIGSLLNLDYWNSLTGYNYFKVIQQDIVYFRDSIYPTSIGDFFKNDIYSSIHVTGSEEFDLLYVLELNGQVTGEDIKTSIQSIFPNNRLNIIVRSYENSFVNEIQLTDDRVFSYSVKDGLLIGSFTSFLVDDALRKLNTNGIGFDWEEKHGIKNKGISVIAYPYFLDKFLNLFIDPSSEIKSTVIDKFCDYLVAGIEIDANKIKFEGEAYKQNSGWLLDCFNGQSSVRSEVARILPENTAVLFSMTFDDPVLFQSQYNKFVDNFSDSPEINRAKSIQELHGIDIKNSFSKWMGNEICIAVIEPPGTSYKNNTIALVKSNDVETSLNSLKKIATKINTSIESESASVKYGSREIGLINIPYLLPYLYGPAFDLIQKNYYTELDGYIIFANKLSILRYLIDEFDNKNTLSNSVLYTEITDQLSTEGNLLIFCNIQNSSFILKSFASDKTNSILNENSQLLNSCKGFAIQFINEDTLHADFESSIVFGKSGNFKTNRLFSVELDAPLSRKPAIITDQKQIVVQDDENTIYLLDNGGVVLWKQQIEETIISEIYEVDLFNNQAGQILFNTASYLYVIDRSGRAVGNYPIKLPAKASAPLTLSGLNNSRDLYIYVPCINKRVYAYQLSGKPLPGWSFASDTGVPDHKVSKINYQLKSYLVISDNSGSHYLTNYFGEVVRKGDESHTLSKGSSVYQSDDVDQKFVWVSSGEDGSLIRMKLSGEFDNVNMNINGSEHGYIYGEIDNDSLKEHLIIDDNVLYVYDEDIVLKFRAEFEENMSPDIQLFNTRFQECFIGVRSVESNKIWLLNSSGEILPGFPVKGSSRFNIEALSKNGDKSLVVGSVDGSLYFYSIK